MAKGWNIDPAAFAGLVADVRRAMRPGRYRDALRTPEPRLPAGRNTPLK